MKLSELTVRLIAKGLSPVSVGSIIAVFSCANVVAGSRHPNVLFVMADEWRYVSTGYSGDPNAETPALDRFAAQSINVRNAIADCPVCGPSRASLMTGQYPLTDGVYINDAPLQPRGTTLGEAFAAAGYYTGYIGKWHLYGSPEGHSERRLSYIPKSLRFGFEYWKAAECTHDYDHSIYYEDDDRRPKYWAGYDADSETRDACAFIRGNAHANRPFFLVVSWGPPHYPIDYAPERYRRMYKLRRMVFRPNVPAGLREEAVTDMRGYYANIAALDQCFGQLIETLQTSGIANDTVVIFTSDHGDMMYSQGLKLKQLPWDESIRIPLLIRYPRRFGSRGRASNALMNTPDIMPTLLGLCGISVPRGVQGIDWSASLIAPRAEDPTSAFIDLPVPFNLTRTYGIAEYRGVRTLRYTYIRSINGPWLLYDNKRDPYQKNNLCGEEAMRVIQENLEKQLQVWLKKTGDEFLPATDYLRRDRLENFDEVKVPIGSIQSPWGDWRSTDVNSTTAFKAGS